MIDQLVEQIQNAYTLIEKLNISFSGLIGIAAVLALVFVLAVREMFAWFFKVDSIKRDIKRLRITTQSLEAEIKTLQALVKAANEPLKVVGPEAAEQAPLAKAAGERSGGFDIVH